MTETFHGPTLIESSLCTGGTYMPERMRVVTITVTDPDAYGATVQTDEQRWIRAVRKAGLVRVREGTVVSVHYADTHLGEGR